MLVKTTEKFVNYVMRGREKLLGDCLQIVWFQLAFF